jgi:protein-L-isoaspartate O-methyltransferase
MRWVPREWFLPPHLALDAYSDAPLPIGSGQTISQPYVVALMTQELHPATDRILEIGTGSGYQTAVLSRLAPSGRIFTMERLPICSSRRKIDSAGSTLPTSRRGSATARRDGRRRRRSTALSWPPPRLAFPDPWSVNWRLEGGWSSPSVT